MKKAGITTVLFLVPFIALGGTDSFAYTVTSVHAASEDGEIATDTEHLKKQVGSTFSVERKSGGIRVGYFINNRPSKNVEVVNEPDDKSYCVVSKSHDPYVSVGYLYIENHRKWLKKPCTYTSSGDYVYSGYCM